MNRSFNEGLQPKLNSGLFLRRSRKPKQVDFGNSPHTGFTIGSFSVGGRSATSLNNAYSFGVSGSVAAIRYMPHFTARLTEFWYCTGSKNGTPTGALTIEVREASGGTSALLPATLITSESHTPTADNTFQQVKFTNPPLFEINKIYYIIIGDAAGNATNFYRIWSQTELVTFNNQSSLSKFGTITTTNGFATNGTAGASHMGFLKFDNGVTIGSVITGGGTSGSNTNKRGYLIEPLGLDCEIYGVQVAAGANISGVEVFAKSQGPNDAPLYRQTMTDANRNLGQVYFDRPFRMLADRAYRVVLTYSANSSNPGQVNAVFAPGSPPREGANMFDDRVFPCLQNANKWDDSHRLLGVNSYAMIIMMRRIYDPRT